MKEITLKLKHHFDAAHFLENYTGPCGRLHGHRWNVIVFAKGEVKENDMLIDFTIIKKEIDRLDHDSLNDIVKFNPTAENITLYLLERFERAYPDVKFIVRVYESPEASVEAKSEGWYNGKS